MEQECRGQRSGSRERRDGGAPEGSGRAWQRRGHGLWSSWSSRGGGGAGGSQRRKGVVEQKEEEKEEECKGAHDAYQEPRSPFRYDRPGSKGGGTPEAPEESQASEPQGQGPQEFVKLQLQRLFNEQLNSGGGPGRRVVLPVSAPQRIWRRFPGVLTSTMILEAQRVMLLQLGAGLHEAETRSLRPIVSQYCRQHLMASMAPPVAR